jgi:hypothetical protein
MEYNAYRDLIAKTNMALGHSSKATQALLKKVYIDKTGYVQFVKGKGYRYVQFADVTRAKKAAKGPPAKKGSFAAKIKNAKPGSMIATRIGMVKVPAKKKAPAKAPGLMTALFGKPKTKAPAKKKRSVSIAAVPAASMSYQQSWHPRTFERPGKVTKRGTRVEYLKDISGVGWRSTPTSFVKSARTQPWWRWAALRGIARGGKSEISSPVAVRKQIRYQLGVGPQQLYRMTEHRPYQAALFSRLGRTRALKKYEKLGYGYNGMRYVFITLWDVSILGI